LPCFALIVLSFPTLYSPNDVEKLSEKPHARANLLAIRRLIAT
jgi:hypothetical protein